MLDSFKASLVRMEYTRFLIVLLIAFGRRLLAMQNFKLDQVAALYLGGDYPVL